MSSTDTPWFRPRGSLSRDGWQTVVDDSLDGWQHTGLRVAELGHGVEHRLAPAQVERMVVPLVGDVVVEWSDARGGSGTVELAGRASVFDGPADVVYLGVGAEARLTGTGRVAVAEAPADRVLDVQVLRRDEVPVEIRGAGRSTRQVHNFGTPDGLHAQSLIVCEVVTPAENWSSYPPHKHDEAVEGVESQLEEIYYFEAAVTRGADAPATADPFGLFSTYGSAAGEIEVDRRVRTGDVSLVPFGYHGPAVAAPGYDLYYLNVMAGPGAERAWLISDDPAHGWVRQQWLSDAPDPRLPYTSDPHPRGPRR
jgi:5-deoxy-glucuronate isomerase